MIEYRSFGVTAVMAGDSGKLTGLAAPFNSQATIGQAPWGFRESISPGAFKKTIQEADVVFLLNHNTAQPIARKSAGTLELRESERGLEIEADPPEDVSYVKDLRANVKAGNIRGMSFGFEVIKEAWTDDDGNPSDKYSGTQRNLQEIRLIEVSAVTFPAYDTTTINARDAVSAARDIEDVRADKQPYGSVTYADPGYQSDKVKRYPLDSESHVRAAWAYINMPKNASKYTSEQLASIKSKIKAAAKKYGITINDENAKPAPVDTRAMLEEALGLFTEAGITSLPPAAQRAVSIIATVDIFGSKSAVTPVAPHDDGDEDGDDNFDDGAEEANEAEGLTEAEMPPGQGKSAHSLSKDRAEAGKTTSEIRNEDDALRLEIAKARSREFELGI